MEKNDRNVATLEMPPVAFGVCLVACRTRYTCLSLKPLSLGYQDPVDEASETKTAIT